MLRALALPVLLADRAAARLRGALVRVHDLEFWVDEADVDVPALETALEGIGAQLWPSDPQPSAGTGRAPRLALLEGGLHGRDLRFRGMRDFADLLARAARIDVPLGPLLVPTVDDTTVLWPI